MPLPEFDRLMRKVVDADSRTHSRRVRDALYGQPDDIPEHTHELKIGDSRSYCACGFGPASKDDVDDHIADHA